MYILTVVLDFLTYSVFDSILKVINIFLHVYLFELSQTKINNFFSYTNNSVARFYHFFLYIQFILNSVETNLLMTNNKVVKKFLTGTYSTNNYVFLIFLTLLSLSISG